MPFFSIIIPTYNRANLLSKAIQSVIEQTFSNWELIIVDDGSTDNTKEVVSTFKDIGIRYIYQTNQERSAARNNGTNHSKGQYICFLDSDDYYLPNHLQTFYNYISTNDNSHFFLYSLKKGEKNTSYPNQYSIYDKLILKTIHSQQVCIPKTIADEYKFNPNINIGEDLELWLRIANKHSIIELPIETIIVQEHEQRTVNISNIIAVENHYSLIKEISKKYKKSLNPTVKKAIKSNALFSIAKHYIFKRNNIKGIIYLSKSILTDLTNKQTKHKFYLRLILGKEIK
jgi:glycosyltransferase involved in cell wall biosynthesis